MAREFLKVKDQICNTQTRRSGGTANSLFNTYKNYVITHVKHMFQIESDT